jgi:hypothetical protein
MWPRIPDKSALQYPPAIQMGQAGARRSSWTRLIRRDSPGTRTVLFNSPYRVKLLRQAQIGEGDALSER